MSSKKKTNNTDEQKNVATTLLPGTNILKGKTREELGDKLDELVAEGGHIIVGCVSQDIETGEFSLQVDYVKDE